MRRDPPDLVLTDVMMPGIGGFALLRALRADPRTRAIPIVLLSARAGEEARIEGVESGADDYVVKPFSSRELVARINAQMALALAARERADLLAREQVARREAELQKQHLHALFMEAPVAIAVLRGPSYVVELANASICEIWRRRHDQVIGRPLFDALPGIARPGVEVAARRRCARRAGHLPAARPPSSSGPAPTASLPRRT